MALPATKTRATLAEYLQREEKSTERHEFHDGEILAMSGGTHRHSRIGANLIGMLYALLKGSSCHVLQSDMRIAIKPSRRYVYPDIPVVCDEPRFDPDDPNQTTITNPSVIIEVLIESTEAHDRGEKFNHYRRLESLQEYVLVTQDRPLIETFTRQTNGGWLLSTWEGADAVVELRTLHLQLPLTEVYAGVSFEEDESEPRT